MKYETLESKPIHDGYLIKLRQDTVLLPNGRTATRDVVEHPGAVAMIPITSDGKVVMVRQYRQSTGENLLEVPAGTINPGENPDDCAVRELIEEINYKAGKLQKLTVAWLAPGYSTEAMHFYLATDLHPCEGEQDEDEFINVESIRLEEAVALAMSGEIRDVKTIAAVLMAQQLLCNPG